MNDEPVINRCPFCGSSNCTFASYIYEPDLEKPKIRFCINCCGCGASGPWVYQIQNDDQNAMRLATMMWNKVHE